MPFAVSAGLLLYALFATQWDLERRRRIVFLAAVISALSLAVALLLNFGSLGLLGALFSAAAATVGGLVGGLGYARAGGDEMMPPETVRKKPRQKQG